MTAPLLTVREQTAFPGAASQASYARRQHTAQNTARLNGLTDSRASPKAYLGQMHPTSTVTAGRRRDRQPMTTRNVHEGIKSEYRFENAWLQTRERLAALEGQLDPGTI